MNRLSWIESAYAFVLVSLLGGRSQGHVIAKQEGASATRGGQAESHDRLIYSIAAAESLAVDTKHHLTVAHKVTNVGSDRDQLSSMAKRAIEAMDSGKFSVVPDRGYFKSEEILACHDDDITAYVP